MTRPLHEASSAVAGVLALILSLAPIDHALASQPEAQTGGFAEAPPPSQALRIIEEQPITLAEPPPPVIEPQPEPAPAIPTVDSRRPRPGTGLIALGALGLGFSAALTITAMAGPGWTNLSRRDAAILAGLSLPSALAGTAMIATGARVNRRYEQWADRNAVSPPRTGNGLLVSGVAVTAVGVAGLGLATQLAITDSKPDRGDWALVGLSGAASTIGLVVLVNGMLTRSKFAAWERAGYLQPGTMALRGGAGMSLAGRF